MKNRNGFTIIELLTVIIFMSILVTVAIRSMGNLQSRTAVRQAQNVFVAMHARTRAQAVEFGETVQLEIDAAGDSLWVTRDGTTLETIRLQNEMGIDIQAEEDTYTLCMNSRGFANESCNSFDDAVTLYFVQGGDSASVEMLPLGQVVY